MIGMNTSSSVPNYVSTVSSSSSREDDVPEDCVIRFDFDSDEDRPIVEGFEDAKCGPCEVAVSGHCSRIMAVMNAMRKQRDFCDVTLLLDKVPLKAHRAVLAAASPALMEMFHQHSFPPPPPANGAATNGCASSTNGHGGAEDLSRRAVGGSLGTEGAAVYQMSKHFDVHTLEQLIEYAYTGKLEVKRSELEDVYFTADRLQMQPIVDACSNHFVRSISRFNCLGIRKLLWESSEHVEQIDEFIRDHFDAITQNGLEFDHLPCLRVDMKGNSTAGQVCDERLVRNVLTWFCEQIGGSSSSSAMSDVLRTHFILSIDGDRCRPLDDVVSDEFQKEVSARQGEQVSVHEMSSEQFAILSHHDKGQQKGAASFDLVHVEKARTGRRLIGLALLRVPGGGGGGGGCKKCDDAAAAAGVQADHSERSRVELASFVITPKWAEASTSSSSDPAEARRESTTGTGTTGSTGGGGAQPLLPPLTMARSGFGVVKTADGGGAIVVAVGGFNSGSCFRTVECCRPGDSRWTAFSPDMKSRRARLYAFCTQDEAHPAGHLYALSGGDGTKTLATVEKLKMPLSLDPRPPWTTDNQIRIMCEKAAFHFVRADRVLYSIGGLQAASSVASDRCYVNRLIVSGGGDDGDGGEEEESWSGWQRIANMNEGRYEASVISNGESKLYVFGGNDGWKCRNSCEVYDPTLDRWTTLPRMPECNRCSQLAKIGHKIYLIGGTDGSLTSGAVHIFDTRSEEWTRGPSLNVKRTNFGIVEVEGIVHVIGGFDGSQFLRSVEVLDEQLKMWTIVSESTRRKTQPNQ